MAENLTKKSFLSNPENWINLAVIGGVAAILYKYLPNIILLLENSLYATFLLVILGAVLYLVLDNRFRTALVYLYRTYFIKKLISIDPIEMAKNYIEDLRKEHSNLMSKITDLSAQKGILENTIKNNNKEIEQALALASQARKTDNKKQIILNSNKAGRRDESNATLRELLGKFELLYSILIKMAENADFYINDLSDTVYHKEKEYKILKAGHSALTSAMNILKSGSDKRLIFDEAMEQINTTIGTRIGEMQHFINMSGDIMNSIDLQNGVFLEKGMALLDKIEEEGNKMLLVEKSSITSIPTYSVNSKESSKVSKYFN